MLLETSDPVLKLFFKVSCNVNVPLAAPKECSFCFDLSGTKASIESLNFSLLTD